ncbi:hypothetical protein OC846_006699 [Tilletia horrida]|uniref:Carboxylic ester hydrolase n=1 Tax=Tilletia horrida TaxID=155126 RepID=A0AAN6GI93_9BASI|nr:hypothetical protein OC846_006699 [Tilletia horrida]
MSNSTSRPRGIKRRRIGRHTGLADRIGVLSLLTLGSLVSAQQQILDPSEPFQIPPLLQPRSWLTPRQIAATSTNTTLDLSAICSSLATVIPPMLAAGAAPSRENITLDHVFAKYYQTGLNIPSHELFLDLPTGTLLPSDDAVGSINAAGTDWEPEGVIADMQYGLETSVQALQGGLPSFCRFGASIITSNISQVYMEVWLPLPDSMPTSTTDPDPVPFDNSTASSSSDGGDDSPSSNQSPAVRRTEPVPAWLRSPVAKWQESMRRRQQERDNLQRRLLLANARRPPANFTPAPDSAWQGRMIHIGTGAAKGAIIWPNMKQILARYREVVVADNVGHFSSAISEDWATNDATRRDSGYRAVHLSTMVGQVVTKTFYNVKPGQHSQQQQQRRRRGTRSALQQRMKAARGGSGERHHHHGGDGAAEASSYPNTPPPDVPISTTAEDADYADVMRFLNLRQSYASRLGFNSYFIGCSMGGRQGLSEAALYPADYDGILAGSPAISFTNTSAWQIWVNSKVSDPKDPGFISTNSYELIRNSVLRACDGLDGVLDGVVTNTSACTFDVFAPSLLCGGPGAPAKGCFNLAQMATLEGIYSNYTVGLNDTLVHTGLLPGSEISWLSTGGLTGKPFGVAPQFFQYQILNQTDVAPAMFNPFTQVSDAVVSFGNQLDPGRTNTWYEDLSPFLSHGKLLHTHGLADQLIPPGDSVRYYQAVSKAVVDGDHDALAEAYRLFLVPGMAHCRLGDGPWNFGGAAQTDMGARPLSYDAKHDATLALFDWVEKGEEPEYIVGAAYKTREEQAGYQTTTSIRDDRRFQYGVKNTRKLCPWPLQAHLLPNATVSPVRCLCYQETETTESVVRLFFFPRERTWLAPSLADKAARFSSLRKETGKA